MMISDGNSNNREGNVDAGDGGHAGGDDEDDDNGVDANVGGHAGSMAIIVQALNPKSKQCT